MQVKFKLVGYGAKPPFRKRDTDAGIDLYVNIGQRLLVNPGETRRLPTGVAFEIPATHFGDIRARSSTTLRGLAVAGVVDSSYRGECFILVTNMNAELVAIEDGERLAQMLLMPVPKCELVEVDVLSETDRGAQAFGSTGR